MKNVALNLFVSMSLILTLPVSEAFPENTADNFYPNPLLLNGKSVEFSIFSLVNTGKISLVKGNPDSELKTKIPFYIYIKRSGKIVDAYSYAHNNAVTEFEMAEILKFAQVGDQIFIDPAGKNEQVGRRIIVVKPEQLWPRFDWSYGLNKRKDGC
ncbi:hypothetical protein [Dyadobacter sp. NIV53]|uniref:hypothetical protein n=1 Tax=Dyadobacter sp. NIV53 TaxID=2861765 RepID=UPI001C870EBE|nr:hypothetical protein [Dyadobacter sp. NIV53]